MLVVTSLQAVICVRYSAAFYKSFDASFKLQIHFVRLNTIRKTTSDKIMTKVDIIQDKSLLFREITHSPEADNFIMDML